MKLGAATLSNIVAIGRAGDTHDLPFANQTSAMVKHGLADFNSNTGWYLTWQGRIVFSEEEDAQAENHVPGVDELIAEYERRSDSDAKLARTYNVKSPQLAATYRTRSAVLAGVAEDLRLAVAVKDNS